MGLMETSDLETRRESWHQVKERASRQHVCTRRKTKPQLVLVVRTPRAELGTEHGTVRRVASRLGFGTESARSWVRQAGVDEGHAAGVSTAEA